MGTDFLYPSVLASDASAPLGIMIFLLRSGLRLIGGGQWRMITTPHLPTVSHGV